MGIMNILILKWLKNRAIDRKNYHKIHISSEMSFDYFKLAKKLLNLKILPKITLNHFRRNTVWVKSSPLVSKLTISTYSFTSKKFIKVCFIILIKFGCFVHCWQPSSYIWYIHIGKWPPTRIKGTKHQMLD